MGNSIYALPSDNISSSATWTVVSGTANAAYPVTNLGNLDPAKPFKATGGSVTARATVSSSTLVAIMLANHNLAGGSATLTNGAGMSSQTITIPANTSDALCINPWKDFSAASSRTSTTWDLALTSVLGNVALGEVLLLTATRDLLWRWELTSDREYLVKTHETFGGSRLKYNKRIRRRSATGSAPRVTRDSSALHVLHQNAVGSVNPFFFVFDDEINDAWLVQFTDDRFGWTHHSLHHVEGEIGVEEVSSGPPLF